MNCFLNKKKKHSINTNNQLFVVFHIIYKNKKSYTKQMFCVGFFSFLTSFFVKTKSFILVDFHF